MSSDEFVASLAHSRQYLLFIITALDYEVLSFSQALKMYKNNHLTDIFSFFGVGVRKVFGWTSKRQLLLYKALQNIFPHAIMHFNYKGNPNLRFRNGNRIELDIFVPEHSLAFEYQGEQHFQSTIKGSHVHQRRNDEEKKIVCIIPCYLTTLDMFEIWYYSYCNTLLVGWSRIIFARNY
jgi:hypothetical protein